VSQGYLFFIAYAFPQIYVRLLFFFAQNGEYFKQCLAAHFRDFCAKCFEFLCSDTDCSNI